ncbi:MAG: hypothetical protein U5K81_10125 [Trueperaceae bacterium]|nr:hypothetical protein [Trueperaceae bacterium]
MEKGAERFLRKEPLIEASRDYRERLRRLLGDRDPRQVLANEEHLVEPVDQDAWARPGSGTWCATSPRTT